jgi:hypothetical protein
MRSAAGSLSQCIAALPEDHWKLDREETDAIREWAEVNYLPSELHLEKRRGLAAPLSRHPRPPATGRVAGRR